MTTIAEARTELATALEAGGLTVSKALGRIVPPTVVIYGNGIDPEHVGRGQVEAGFRAMILTGKADAEISHTSLDDLTLAVVAVIRAMAGWRLGLVGPATIRKTTSGEWLTADVAAHRFVTMPTLPSP